MEETAKTTLTAWENFYVIVGSSGAALTGLQFVVIALISEWRTKSTAREISAFGTPTIVHFCAVLLVAATMTAPWQALVHTGSVLAAIGIAGLSYCFMVVRRARHQTGYAPVFEDWLWHAALPLVAYASILICALLMRNYAHRVLFGVGAAVILLLFIGIHNAWDTVTWIATQSERNVEKE